MKTKSFLVVIVVLVMLLFIGFKLPKHAIAPVPDDNTGTVDETANWKTSTDLKTGITFKYPETLGTKYINTVDWPPAVQVIDSALTCVDAGDEIARAGKTESIVVAGNIYCLTRVTEGAAGSIYTQYAYAKVIAGKSTIILTFTLRAPQCDNYDDPQKSECKAEEQSFDIDKIVNLIMAPIQV